LGALEMRVQRADFLPATEKFRYPIVDGFFLGIAKIRTRQNFLETQLGGPSGRRDSVEPNARSSAERRSTGAF
jgi:hypothetical protein